jgi:hypothetical protein
VKNALTVQNSPAGIQRGGSGYENSRQEERERSTGCIKLWLEAVLEGGIQRARQGTSHYYSLKSRGLESSVNTSTVVVEA